MCECDETKAACLFSTMQVMSNAVSRDLAMVIGSLRTDVSSSGQQKDGTASHWIPLNSNLKRISLASALQKVQILSEPFTTLGAKLMSALTTIFRQPAPLKPPASQHYDNSIPALRTLSAHPNLLALFLPPSFLSLLRHWSTRLGRASCTLPPRHRSCHRNRLASVNPSFCWSCR